MAENKFPVSLFLSNLPPRRQRKKLLRRAKHILARMSDITSGYDSLRFLMIEAAIRLIDSVAADPTPPLQVKISGLKWLCSTFITRCLFFG